MALAFLLFKKYYENNENGEIIKKYLKRMIKLYCVWNIIYLPLAIYGYCINKTSLIKAFILYIKDLFFKGEHYFSWSLCFLLATIY